MKNSIESGEATAIVAISKSEMPLPHKLLASMLVAMRGFLRDYSGVNDAKPFIEWTDEDIIQFAKNAGDAPALPGLFGGFVADPGWGNSLVDSE